MFSLSNQLDCFVQGESHPHWKIWDIFEQFQRNIIFFNSSVSLHHLKFFEYPYLLALLVSIQNGIFHDILKEKPIFMKLLKTLSR